MYIHVSLVVSIPGSNELKSKPTQHSCKELLSLGIQPDVIVCRADSEIPDDIIQKISLFCNIPPENVIPNLTAPILYEVPLMLEQTGMANVVCKRLGLPTTEPDLEEWSKMVVRAKNCKDTVTIALVGKYVALHDAYLSVVEALTHGGIENDVKVEIRWVDSEQVEDGNVAQVLQGCDGVLVPGGFATAASRAKLRRCAGPESRMSRSLASALACRWRLWSSPEMWRVWKTPTPASCAGRRHIRSSI